VWVCVWVWCNGLCVEGKGGIISFRVGLRDTVMDVIMADASEMGCRVRVRGV